MALIPKDPVNPQGQIDPKSIHSPSDIENDAALQITVQDAKNTETWQQTNYWGIRWREADALYQSPPGVMMWEGTTVPRANNNRYVVAETTNTIHEQIMNGLFYETPSFLLRPRPTDTQNTIRAISALISIQLDEIKIRQEVDWGIHSCLLFGTGIWKWGYENFTQKVTKYKRVGEELPVATPSAAMPKVTVATEDSMEFEEVEEDEEIFRPTFENKDIRYVLVDPGCSVPDIRKAKFVIDRMFLTYRDLEKLADEEYIYTDPKTKKKSLKKRYMLPSKDEIRSWFEPPREEVSQPDPTVATDVQNTSVIHHAMPRFRKTTEDPLNEPLEVLERWDNDKVTTVIQRVKCIRNEPNEYKCIPFLSCNWWPIPNAFWGLGLGRVIGTEQRIQAGLINACLDLANLIVNPMFVRAKGANIETQQIRQRIGGIITADGDPTKALTILEQPSIPNEILQQIALSEGRVEKASGASQAFTSGATTSRAGAARSGTGAAAMINATMSRIGATAEVFSRQVFEPLLYKMHELNKRKTPMSYVKKLIGNKMGEDYAVFNPQDYMDAPAVFEVLAGSHLAAKAQMAQSLFMMIQLFESPQLLSQLTEISGKVVDVEELFHMVHDISGWKNYYNVVRDMTPEEQQKAQAKQEMNSPMAKAQAQQQVQQQQQQGKSALIDQENEARIVRDMFRDIAKRSTEPELLSGAAPTEGLGSQETA